MLVEILREKITEMPYVKLAYLFGSRVSGHVGASSDYDVGVLLDSDADALAATTRIAHELALTLHTDHIDVVALNRAPIELAHTVIAQGQLFYQRNNVTRVEYEAQVMSRYGDYLPVLRAQREELLQESDYAPRIQRYRTALRRTERTLGEIAAISG